MAPCDYGHDCDFGTHNDGNWNVDLSHRNYGYFGCHNCNSAHVVAGAAAHSDDFDCHIADCHIAIDFAVDYHNCHIAKADVAYSHCHIGGYGLGYHRRAAANMYRAKVVVRVGGAELLPHCHHFQAGAAFGAANNVVAGCAVRLAAQAQFVA
ncbi:MAG: hypothetical protein FD128_2910 [Hyphomonadaceae bacterium]|nr:MAG: hypothetical protein FD128_2910 [Hyphomonadaceae bacterium]